ncbi:unnamed protein product [Choristocarpus tenellus]
MVESTKFHDRIVAHSEATIAPVPLAFAAIHIIKYFMAGTVAGLSECASSYPLDTIKTRLQAPAGRGSFGGPLECLLKTVREDGPLALYRGMSSRLLANMLSSSIMFGANGMLKELLHADSSKPMSARFMMAATGTGVLEAIAYTPLELVKTRMQARTNPDIALKKTYTILKRKMGRVYGRRPLSFFLFGVPCTVCFGGCLQYIFLFRTRRSRRSVHRVRLDHICISLYGAFDTLLVISNALRDSTIYHQICGQGTPV